MNNNENHAQTGACKEYAPTAVILLHKPGAPADGRAVVDLTEDQQRQACRQAAARLGLKIVGEDLAVNYRSASNPDGLRSYHGELGADAVLHAPQRATVLPGVTALVYANDVVYGSMLGLQFVRLPDEESAAR